MSVRGSAGGHGSRIFNRLEQQQSGGSKKQEEADSCYKFPLSIVIITVVVVVQNHRSSRCLITVDEFVFSQRSSKERREREREGRKYLNCLLARNPSSSACVPG